MPGALNSKLAAREGVPRILEPTEVATFRALICQTAVRLLEMQGQDNFTMHGLAAELNVSAMTPYRYYKNEQQIIAAVGGLTARFHP